MKIFFLLTIFILFGFYSCKDDEPKLIGNSTMKVTPENYKFGADGGSIEVKSEGSEPIHWDIKFIKSTVGSTEKFYYPDRDFPNTDEKEINVNIDWFTIKKVRTEDRFTIKVLRMILQKKDH